MKKLFAQFFFTLLHCTFCVLYFTSSSYSQTPATYSSADIYLQLKKLNVLGSVLYIAAHPDDENTRLLACFAKEKLYRTGYLSLTRGDGGQNLIGDEQGIELGLIRTQELLSARRIDGAEQFFSRAYDFGFCKTADEALNTWGHDKILSDVVWVIRKFQPDVIITRFPGDERAGHGHHQASEILAKEAFFAAADSTKFPEQFQFGVHPWQAKRIVWNTYNFGSTNTTSENQFKMDVGAYNSLLGKSYGEIASESRSQHKSQGFGVPRQRGQAFEYFETTAGDAPKNSLFDGIDTTWARVQEEEQSRLIINAALNKTHGTSLKNSSDNLLASWNTKIERDITLIQKKINSIINNYNFEHPEYSIDSLVEVYKLIQSSLDADDHWRNQKLAEIQNIIFNCAGLFAEATTNTEYAVLGDSLQVQFAITKRTNTNINLIGVRMNNFDSTLNNLLPVNQNVLISKTFTVPKGKEVTQPYWIAKPMDKGSFNVSDQLLIGKAQNDPDYAATFIFDIKRTKFFVNKPVLYKHTDPVKGEVHQPLVVIPGLIVAISPSIVLTNVKPGNEQTNNPSVRIDYKSNFDEKQVPVTININQGNSIISTKDTTVDCEKGKTFTLIISLNKIIDKKDGNELTADVFLTVNNHKVVYTHYLKSIQYEHIPNIHYSYRDIVKLVNEEIKIEGKNIGYINGAGDKVAQALQQMGYNVKILNSHEINDDNLKQFDAIIAGVRAYNVNDWLTGKYDVLMRYVQNGGNYIVQYNTSGFQPTKMKIGPYDFSISRTRVTDENAKVHVLLPNSSVLNYPNKISSHDFEGWIQERSLYQAEQFDSAHYEAPLGMHDANEPESNGSLLVAKYGKGNFVYTGLVFFRELPAGVSGAYRLMANLIALPKNK